MLVSNLEVLELLQKQLQQRSEMSSSSSSWPSTENPEQSQQPQRRAFQQRSNQQQHPEQKHQHRDWIERTVVEYLQSMSCTKCIPEKRKELQRILQSSKRMVAKGGSTATTTTTTAAAVTTTTISTTSGGSGTTRPHSTTGFGLTEAEAIQVLNHMPTELVEIHLMIEELPSRMTDRQQEDLLSLVRSYVQDAPQNNDDNDDRAGEEGLIEQEDFGSS